MPLESLNKIKKNYVFKIMYPFIGQSLRGIVFQILVGIKHKKTNKAKAVFSLF